MKLKRILCMLAAALVLSASAVCTTRAAEYTLADDVNVKTVAAKDPVEALGLENPCEVDENGEVALKEGKLIDLILPELLDGQELTSISAESFAGCPYIRSVVIPETILEIGEGAFADCEFLETIYVIGHNEKDLTLGEDWNGDAEVVYVKAALKSVSVTKEPDKVYYVAGDTFVTTGMEVTATYEDDSTKVIDDYVIEGGEELTVGTTHVKVSYTEEDVTVSCTVDITVQGAGAEANTDKETNTEAEAANGNKTEQGTAEEKPAAEDASSNTSEPANKPDKGAEEGIASEESTPSDGSSASSQTDVGNNKSAGVGGDAAPQSSEGVSTSDSDSADVPPEET